MQNHDFLHIMEEHGIRANFQTYLWLLERCLNSGSLVFERDTLEESDEHGEV